MGSLIEELKRREAAARAEAGRLPSRVEELAEELARAEEQVSRLSGSSGHLRSWKSRPSRSLQGRLAVPVGS